MGMKNDWASGESHEPRCIRQWSFVILQEGIDPKRKKAPEGQAGTSGYEMDHRVTESYHKRRVSSPLSGA